MRDLRRDPRVQIVLRVAIKSARYPDVVYTTTRDMSPGGVGIVSEPAFALGDQVSLAIELTYQEKDREPEYLEFRSEVRYAVFEPAIGRYRIGLSFAEQTQQEREMLKSYLAYRREVSVTAEDLPPSSRQAAP